MCDRISCTAKPEYYPALMVRVHSRHPPARVVIGIKFCGICRGLTNLDELLTGDLWCHISDGIAAQGLARPIRELTTLDWCGINSKEAKRFLASRPN